VEAGVEPGGWGGELYLADRNNDDALIARYSQTLDAEVIEVLPIEL